MTDNELQQIKQLIDEAIAGKGMAASGSCPHCGACQHCGRGAGYYQSYYVPQYTWIGGGSETAGSGGGGGAGGGTVTVYGSGGIYQANGGGGNCGH